MTLAWHGAVCLEAPAGFNVDVGVGELCVVRAGELDLPLRCGQLLAARAGVLQGFHFVRVAKRRETEEKGRGEEDKRQRGNWDRFISVEENHQNLRQQICRFRTLFTVTFMLN